MKNKWQIVLLGGIGLVGLSLALAWISADYRGVDGWIGFFLLGLLSTGLFAGVWWLLRHERMPSWLLLLTICAALLHLAAGIFWFKVLPRYGHGTEAEKAGFVMADAYARDTLAWRRSVHAGPAADSSASSPDRPGCRPFRENRA